MKIRRFVLLALLACACRPFDAVLVGELPYGEVAVFTSVDGPNIQHRLADGIVVSLDSAIQGYGVSPIAWSADSAKFQPVLVGQHDVTLRGVPANCTIVDGDRRVGHVESNRRTIFTFEAHCGP